MKGRMGCIFTLLLSDFSGCEGLGKLELECIASEVTVKTDLLPRELAPSRVKAAGGFVLRARQHRALSNLPHRHIGRTSPALIRHSDQIPDAACSVLQDGVR